MTAEIRGGESGEINRCSLHGILRRQLGARQGRNVSGIWFLSVVLTANLYTAGG